jgi:hypothetical protein
MSRMMHLARDDLINSNTDIVRGEAFGGVAGGSVRALEVLFESSSVPQVECMGPREVLLVGYGDDCVVGG